MQTIRIESFLVLIFTIRQSSHVFLTNISLDRMYSFTATRTPPCFERPLFDAVISVNDIVFEKECFVWNFFCYCRE